MGEVNLWEFSDLLQWLNDFCTVSAKPSKTYNRVKRESVPKGGFLLLNFRVI